MKSLIESAGYTQRTFAQAMGLSLSAITYYVAGEKLPRVDRFMMMAEKLGVSPKILAKSMGINVGKVPDDKQLIRN